MLRVVLPIGLAMLAGCSADYSRFREFEYLCQPCLGAPEMRRAVLRRTADGVIHVSFEMRTSVKDEKAPWGIRYQACDGLLIASERQAIESCFSSVPTHCRLFTPLIIPTCQTLEIYRWDSAKLVAKSERSWWYIGHQKAAQIKRLLTSIAQRISPPTSSAPAKHASFEREIEPSQLGPSRS